MYPPATNHKTMTAVPLQLFMKDLLHRGEFASAHDKNHSSCTHEASSFQLIVDNAISSSPLQQSSKQRKGRDALRRKQNRRWDNEDEKKVQQRLKKGSTNVLDISDHSKKDSRWVSSMSTRSDQDMSPEKNYCSSPLQTRPRSLSPPAGCLSESPSTQEKDTAPRQPPYTHGRRRMKHFKKEKEEQHEALQRNAVTIQSVDEAIAICGFSTPV